MNGTWLKLQADTFEDEKLRIIGAGADRYLVEAVFIRCLCLAKKAEADQPYPGILPYTAAELAIIWGIPEPDLARALATLARPTIGLVIPITQDQAATLGNQAESTVTSPSRDVTIVTKRDVTLRHDKPKVDPEKLATSWQLVVNFSWHQHGDFTLEQLAHMRQLARERSARYRNKTATFPSRNVTVTSRHDHHVTSPSRDASNESKSNIYTKENTKRNPADLTNSPDPNMATLSSTRPPGSNPSWRPGTLEKSPRVWLKEEEYKDLVAKHGQVEIDSIIRQVSLYKETWGMGTAGGKKDYRNDAAAVRNWLNRDRQRDKPGPRQDPYTQANKDEE